MNRFMHLCLYHVCLHIYTHTRHVYQYTVCIFRCTDTGVCNKNAYICIINTHLRSCTM